MLFTDLETRSRYVLLWEAPPELPDVPAEEDIEPGIELVALGPLMNGEVGEVIGEFGG